MILKTRRHNYDAEDEEAVAAVPQSCFRHFRDLIVWLSTRCRVPGSRCRVPNHIVDQYDYGTHRYSWLGRTVTVGIVTARIHLLVYTAQSRSNRGVVTFEVFPPQSQSCSVKNKCSALHS